MNTLTPRGKALRWLTDHRGLTEQPPGSNSDLRADGIHAAQMRVGKWLINLPWCGVWAANALLAGGVDFGSTHPGSLASVATIESLAKERKRPFRDWVTTADRDWSQKVLRGDLVVLFGYGVHVEVVRSTAWVYRKLGLIRTDGGNTSSGNEGSQDNGGGSYSRYRKISDVRGFARVNYPG